MKYKAAFALLLCQIVGYVSAARRIDAHLRARETMQRRRDVRLLERRREEEVLDANELFGLTQGESMSVVRQAVDAMGTVVERLQEEYDGIPVFDGQVTVRANKNGHLTGDASGTLVQDIDEDLPDAKPYLTDEETLHIAIQAEGDDMLKDVIGDVSYKRWVYLDKNDKARLVNTVSYLIDSVKRPFYIIDVKNGEILRHYNALNNFSCGKKKTYKAFGGNRKQGKITYGDIPYCLNLTIAGDMCYLENEYVRVVDMKHSDDESISETASFNCKDSYDDEVNDAYSPAIDAFFYGTVVGKMYEEWFNSTALSDKIVLRVHYKENYENAFWNGVNCTFGDGNKLLYPLPVLEIVSHEIAHGTTEQGSNLMYFDEFGGVNEAFSDIMGEVAETFLSSSDLVVGKYVMKPDKILRDFKDPKKDFGGDGITFASEMKPDIDPHSSSGVFRRVWYVAVEQKGMPVKDAARIFLHANRMYWHHAGTFFDCSCGVLRAAIDLGYSTTPFRRAFKDVGIEDCEISGHVFHLAHNITQNDVTVSDTIHPMFKFEATNWTDSIVISAKSPSGGIIKITVQSENLEDDTFNDSNVIAEGETDVTLENMTNHDVFITLSTDDLNPHYDVEVKAGYTCVESYNGSDATKEMYKYFCHITDRNSFKFKFKYT